MREWIDWVVPIGIGVALGVAAMLVGEWRGWSNGAIGSLGTLAVLVGVMLRFVIHDYDQDARREGGVQH